MFQQMFYAQPTSAPLREGLPTHRAVLRGPGTNAGHGDKSRLSKCRAQLSFAPYAEIDCSQQNTQISGKTFQDHRARQSAKGAIVAPAFAFGQECETETPTGQNSTSGCYRCRPRQGKPAVRLTAIAQLNRVTAHPLFRCCAWSSRSLFL